jgi:E3 ubiquitin-protein ligase TRIP12
MSSNDDIAQMLMRRVAGGGMRSQHSERLAGVARALADHADEGAQYVALMELCESLNMATEDFLAAVRPDQLVPPILGCMQKQHNPDLMFLSARVLTYLIDAVPTASNTILQTEGGFDVIADILRNIMDVELAEQCLTAVDKIAAEHPSNVLRNGGPTLMLQFVDFFSLSVQRRAVLCVANMCKRCTAATFAHVRGVLPQLRGLATHDDAKLSTAALQALTRVAMGCRDKGEFVLEVFGDIAPGLIEILEQRKMDAVFGWSVKLIAEASAHPAVVEMLIELGIVGTITTLLRVGRPGAGVVSPGRSPGASPIRSGDIGLPPAAVALATPPRDPNDSPIQTPPSAKPAVPLMLQPDMVQDLCRALKELLPPVQSEYMLYISNMMLRIAPRRHVAHAPQPHGADEDDDGEEDDDDDGEDDDDDDDEDDDQGMPPAAIFDAMVRAGRLRVENDPRWLACNAGTHSCDICGKGSLRPRDWFRSNTQRDFDACRRCMLVSVVSTAQDEAFTDMRALLADAPRGAGRPAPEALQPVECGRTAMIAAAPYLLLRVAEALPVMLELQREADHPEVRHCCTEFVTRCVAALPAEELPALLADLPLCEHLSALLSVASIHIPTIAHGVFCAATLLDKQLDAVKPLFVREGVLNALAKIKSLAADANVPQGDAAPAVPVHVAVATEGGWYALLAARTRDMMALFLNAEQDKVVVGLTAVGAKLAAAAVGAEWRDAISELCDTMDTAAGVSTFELVNSGVVDTLALAVSAPGLACDDQFRMLMELHMQMSSRSRAAPTSGSPPAAEQGGTTTLLCRFVHQLQAVVAQLESFGTSVVSQTAAAPIRLSLVAHKEGGSQPASPTTGEGEGGMFRTHSSASASSRRKSRDDRVVSVNIEPLATIAAVAEFVQSRLLRTAAPTPNSSPAGNGSRSSASFGASNSGRQTPPDGAAQVDDDDVEDVLPLTEADGAARKRHRSSADGGAQVARAAATLHLRLGDQTLPHSLTMSQVIQQFAPTRRSGEAVVIHYSRAAFPATVKPQPSLTSTANSFAPKFGAAALMRAVQRVNAALMQPLELAAVRATTTVPALVNVLRLLRAIAAASEEMLSGMQFFLLHGDAETAQRIEHLPPLAPHELINQRLNSRVLRAVNGAPSIVQLHDSWCLALAMDCPFLFPLPTRRLLFEVGFFGTSRALLRVNEHVAETGLSAAIQQRDHRVARKKLRVWRDRPLACARRVMLLHGNSRSFFDFQFYGEEGSGQGPTHEFFTLAGEALCNKELGLWRAGEEDTDSAKVSSLLGLYLNPAPCVADVAPPPPAAMKRAASEDTCAVDDDAAEAPARELSPAGFFGRFVARAILDKHVINVRLSPALLRLLRGDEMVFDDIRGISGALYETLFAIASAVARGTDRVVFGKSECSIADLGLTFVLPGVEDIELVPNGAAVAVGAGNAMEYVNAVSRALLCDSVRVAASEAQEHFNQVLSVRGLRLLSLHEWGSLLCGHDAHISMEEFVAHTACDHGFNAASPTIRMLFEVLVAMEPAQQRGFFRFLTGAAMLPIGGLAALKPRFTVVRKGAATDDCCEQEQLPSAMTCQNFLKLPRYDSIEQLRGKLELAVQEGCSAFHFT